MTIEERRVEKVLGLLKCYLDYAEWIGRIPSAKNKISYERKLAFWLIHLKQAKEGKSTCLWRDELAQYAKSRGYENLFMKDTRLLRYFNLSGEVAGYNVVDKTDKMNKDNQSQFLCTKDGITFDSSWYRLMRLQTDPCYVTLEDEFSSLVGEIVGGYKLLGLHNKTSEGNCVCYCSKEEKGIEIVKKIEFYPIEALKRYIDITKGNPVSEESSPIFGTNVEDMTGQKIGRWSVIGYSCRASNSEGMWHCICDCGAISDVSGGKLRAGKSLSCGCLKRVISTNKNEEEVEESEVLA